MDSKQAGFKPAWEIDPAAELWRRKCDRATKGERISLIRHGRVAGVLISADEYEWLDANHPVYVTKHGIRSQRADTFLMATNSLEAEAASAAEEGRRTIVLCRGRESGPVAAVVPVSDLRHLEGRSLG